MPKAQTKPNIVFILADDMGYGDFSAFNGGLSSTPTLDALMQESVCLSQHYTASPVCNPSRACLLTGRYPHRTGSVDTLEWWGLERLSLRERTIAQILQSAGYATGLVGKWHLGAFDPRYHPMQRGFDESVCFRGGMHDYYQWRIEWGEDTKKRSDGRYLTDIWAGEAVQFIERHRSEPFFLHVTFNAPHTPLQAPEEEVRPFMSNDGVSDGVAKIYGMIHRMDTGIAHILDTLDRLGLRDDTIVFFTSDNGPQFGNDTTRFNCQFKGAKGTTYEGGIRLPMIIRWPNGLPAAREVNDMVHFSDWFPTILSMAGVPLPADNLPLDGVDVLPLLRGEGAVAQPTRCWQWNRYEPVPTLNAAIRDGDWKLVRPSGSGAVPDIHWLWVSMYGPEHFEHCGILHGQYPPLQVNPPGAPELYNIAEDPLEQHNLAGENEDMLRKLNSKLDNWFEDVERDYRSTPEYREHLSDIEKMRAGARSVGI